MSNQNSEAVSLLNELLEKSYDAEKGYKKAAQDVNSTLLADYFKKYAEQRYRFGHQIKEEISRLGGTPDKGDSITSKLHRTWIDVRSMFTSGDVEDVIEECKRGEKAAIEDYEDALTANVIPEPAKSVIMRQHQEIKEALAELNTLERQVTAKA